MDGKEYSLADAYQAGGKLEIALAAVSVHRIEAANNNDVAERATFLQMTEMLNILAQHFADNVRFMVSQRAGQDAARYQSTALLWIIEVMLKKIQYD